VMPHRILQAVTLEHRARTLQQKSQPMPLVTHIMLKLRCKNINSMQDMYGINQNSFVYLRFQDPVLFPSLFSPSSSILKFHHNL